MKKQITLIIILLICLIITTGNAQNKNFPTVKEMEKATRNILINPGSFQQNGKEYRADYCMVSVPENRIKPDSKIIYLPILRIYCTGNNPKEPVFTLGGGPGNPNISEWPPLYFLENHDIVMVGYRGIDGQTILDCPEISKALQKTKGSLLSEENIKKMAQAFERGYKRKIKQGFDINAYNIVEVIDDIELARKRLGYQKINLSSGSWGTRIAYFYGLRYPESIHRSIMTGINTPGKCIWDPHTNDSILLAYGELWKNDSSCLERSPDIINSIKYVLKNMPKEWYGFKLEPDHVKIGMFIQLSQIETAVKVFDAFVAAENGDFSGIAYLSLSAEILRYGLMKMNFGESVAKAYSADFEAHKNYFDNMMPESCIIGSPSSKFMWSPLQNNVWPMKQIPDEYRKLRISKIETLLINGNLDIMTPLSNAKELLEYLPNGKLVVLSNMGHCMDQVTLQPDAYQHLQKVYFLTGKVDTTKFVDLSIDFQPKHTFQDEAQKIKKSRVIYKALFILKRVF